MPEWEIEGLKTTIKRLTKETGELKAEVERLLLVVNAAIKCAADRHTLLRYRSISGDVLGTDCMVNLINAVSGYNKALNHKEG